MHQLWECRYAQQAQDCTKIIVCKLVNGAKPFYLASPMQWKHVILASKIPRCLHYVENVWSLFRGIILWSIWIGCNNLVFNNVRWDGCRMQKAIWDALFDYHRATRRRCVKNIKQSPTFEHKILENFDKRWQKNHVICVKEGRFIKWCYNSPHRGFICQVFLSTCWCSPCGGVLYGSFFFAMKKFICAPK